MNFNFQLQNFSLYIYMVELYIQTCMRAYIHNIFNGLIQIYNNMKLVDDRFKNDNDTKLIISGSRNFTNFTYFVEQIENIIVKNNLNVIEIIHGCARGTDTLAERYGIEKSIPIVHYPADWLKYGKSAGPMRNKIMCYYGDFLIAFYSGGRGTRNAIENIKLLNKPYYIVNVIGV